MVEVVIASAIILSATLGLLGVHSLYLRTTLSNLNKVKATYLAEEGLEAMRYLRDVSWDSNIAALSLDTNYGVVLVGGSWQASTTATFVDGFQRVVKLSSVYRAPDGDIDSSGTTDPDTKLLSSSVSWAEYGTTTSRFISTYLTNLYDQ